VDGHPVGRWEAVGVTIELPRFGRIPALCMKAGRWFEGLRSDGIGALATLTRGGGDTRS
jgi:hypothetical protein